MKMLMSLASLLVFVSFNVQAIPPPPPLPAPIGYLNAKLRVWVSTTLTCNDMICPSASEVCDFTVKIPVIESNINDEGYNASLLVDTNGKFVTCKKTFENYDHEMRMSAYATLDPNGLVKVISSAGIGKIAAGATGDGLAMSNSSSNVTVLSQSSPTLKIRNTTGEQLYNYSNPGIPTGLARTRSSVMTTLEFATLQLEPVKP